ncbi:MULTISPECIES: helix-turn-helix transcriptional regulator [Neisseria]|uniref:Peptidase S24-like family protein n=1 Tax=Neisseria musculi TaxID=1815583 RepID=A0A7H1MD88_9NEIS|nr:MULTISPECIES: helix-turn-helix transcriptional regulator [Neisseria]MBF0803596.1 helix-turn-helix transcriptional regulator [Neisseria sp. 19428wB4_WF04]QNT59603.1 peptidase S24-like family protein [Neisseria musculi]TFU43680.1 helix-turn-helix transcriptional regulator [Neisseria sp. WF04]
MNTFKDRLAFLWKNEAKQAKIAADIDMTIAGFSRIWNEGGLPKAETLKKIKQLKGCSIDWLLTGEGEPFPNSAMPTPSAAEDTLGNPVNIDEFVFVPRYDIQAAAGYGRLVGDETPVFSMAFRRYWIENYVTRDTKNLSVISVKGDSMEGVLNDGDSILINHGETMPRDGLYVLRLNENLLVKRLQLMPGGIVNVISANEAYPAFEINLNNMTDDVAIIGRVEWFGRSI